MDGKKFLLANSYGVAGVEIDAACIRNARKAGLNHGIAPDGVVLY